MVQRLYIRNYAIIDELAIDFANGLTIITGETGAGKSILLGALGLIMGKRADTKALYNPSHKCVVEAQFQISHYNLKSYFEKEDIDYADELVIRREISPGGKSRAFVNDTPTNLKVLQTLTSELVDLHQQFDTLDINSMSFQLKMVDALANNKEVLQTYHQIYGAYQKNTRQLGALREADQQSRQETEFLTFQLNELAEVNLEESEQVALEDEQQRLTHSESIKQTLFQAVQFLQDNEPALIGQLEDVKSAFHQISGFGENLRRIGERFDGILAELTDLVSEMEQEGDRTEYDPQRIDEVQNRLDTIYRLQNKHGVQSVASLIKKQVDIGLQLSAFQDLSNQIKQLESEVEEQEAQLVKLAEHLSGRRKSVVDGFARQVEDMLGMLAMPHARIQVDFSIMEDLGPHGWDEITFLFGANKGSRLQEIKDVASGGELSRLALVIKSLVASAIPLPSLIFDEIDSGISGDVALKMGTILRKLSDAHQVISITHSPQIASRADRHFFVYKEIKDERTVTQVKILESVERINAIAVMLSQDPPSASAIANAKELLSQV